MGGGGRTAGQGQGGVVMTSRGLPRLYQLPAGLTLGKSLSRFPFLIW